MNGIITIGVDSKTTQEEIDEIRLMLKKELPNSDYRISIIKSGEDDMELSLSRFLAARLI